MFVGVCKLMMKASLEASVSVCSFSELKREGIAAQNSFGCWYQPVVPPIRGSERFGFHNGFS